jgi:hypothetical protein
MRKCSKRKCTLPARRGFRFCAGPRCSELWKKEKEEE